MDKKKNEIAKLRKLWQAGSKAGNSKRNVLEKNKDDLKFEDIGPGYCIGALGLSKYYRKA